MRLRVKDFDFEMKQLTVRDGEGTKDRFTVLAEGLIPELRTLQELLGHHDVSTTMIYTHVLRQGGAGMKSPLDCL